jgi:hypothetical protein
VTRAEARLRDALVASILPAPGRGLPAAGDVDLSAFWPRFDARAPALLRFALRVAVIVVGAIAPRLLGYGRSLPDLDADEREAVITWAHRAPAIGALVEAAKVVTCLAYFDDPAVDAAGRRRS